MVEQGEFNPYIVPRIETAKGAVKSHKSFSAVLYHFAVVSSNAFVLCQKDSVRVLRQSCPTVSSLSARRSALRRALISPNGNRFEAISLRSVATGSHLWRVYGLSVLYGL